nr:lysozyme [Methylobacterium sp. L1A1]
MRRDLRRDIARFVRTVAQALPEPLPQHAFDALVSLSFNIGPAAFLRSTVLRRLRAGDRAGAAEAMLLWNRPAVLIPRRQAEVDQFRTPYETALPRPRRSDPPLAASIQTEPAETPSPGWVARLRAWLGSRR